MDLSRYRTRPLFNLFRSNQAFLLYKHWALFEMLTFGFSRLYRKKHWWECHVFLRVHSIVSYKYTWKNFSPQGRVATEKMGRFLDFATLIASRRKHFRVFSLRHLFLYSSKIIYFENIKLSNDSFSRKYGKRFLSRKVHTRVYPVQYIQLSSQAVLLI